jgi:hypothetical protein
MASFMNKVEQHLGSTEFEAAKHAPGWQKYLGFGPVRGADGVVRTMRIAGTGTVHAAGMDWARFSLGIQKGGRIWGRALGLAGTAYAAYQGYQESGAWGAAKGAAGSVAESYVFGVGWKLLGPYGTAAGIGGSAIAGTIAGAAAVEIGGAAGGALSGISISNIFSKGIFSALARPMVADHMHSLAKLEMGRPVVDEFGTVATMRQRSVMAIQNSKINGRSGIGNEATYSFRSYFR